MKKESPHIVRDQELPPSMDFDFLRKEAIDLTQQASGDRWTDYNFHDPGITILEQFCFALTDIAYRTNLDIESLLFHSGEPSKIRTNHGFFPPEEVFPSGPITEDDYRVLLLDGFPNMIRNCWVEKIQDHGEGIRGLYSVTLLLDINISEDQHAEILQEIRNFLCRYRNICEDVDRIMILKPMEVTVSADIDLFQDANSEEVLARVLFEVEQYLNPIIPFRSFEDLEREGIPLEEIFNCTSHTHGFIDRKSLLPKQQQFYVSRIGDLFASVPGVKFVRNLTVKIGGMPVSGDILEVTLAKYLTLGFSGIHFDGDFFEKSKLNIFKGGAISSYSGQTVINLLEIGNASKNRNYPVRLSFKPAHISALKTEELRSYQSIQKTFPAIYGVGDFTPAREEGLERQGQSAQLKAYLLLFDQLMANHLAQLTGISEMFSIHDFDPKAVTTYYSQLISNEQTDSESLLVRVVAPRNELLKRIETLRESGPELFSEVLQEIEMLEFDLVEKAATVKEMVRDFLKKLPSVTPEQMRKSNAFKNRSIVKLSVQLLESFPKSTRFSLVGRGSRSISDEQREMVRQLDELITEEWLELPQRCRFTQRHLDQIMSRFDNASDRKNRILSHYLARFGESFRSDFHLRFTSLLDGNDDEKIARKMISLKSIFLREVTQLSRFRAGGLNYRVNGDAPFMPLQRRLALQLNLEHDPKKRLASAEKTKSINAVRLTKNDIVIGVRTDGKKIIRPNQPAEKITFLVNGSDYYTYLFKFGVRASNYKMVSEDNLVVIYFTPSNRHLPTRLLECASRAEAETRIRSIVDYLKEINARQEGFHLLEHILLRPMNMDACQFNILGSQNAVILKSKVARPRKDQQRDAFDTALLCCYSTNYKILKNAKKELVVMVKNLVGKELAVSSQTFLTELEAQKFIDTNVAFFNDQKNAGTLNSLLELDDEDKFFFCLLDPKGVLLFKGLETSDLSSQETTAREALTCGLYPARYSTRQEAENNFSIILTDSNGKDLARSPHVFPTALQAGQFIQKCIRMLEEARDPSRLVEYRRVHGRNAAVFNSQLSVIYPKWTSRFSDQDFLQLFSQSLHHFVPAHIGVNLIGLDLMEMKAFEDLYFKYITELSNLSIENRSVVSKLSSDLLDLISNRTTQANPS